MTIHGAWCFQPKRADIDFAASIGLRRLDIMLNELSKARAPQRFEMVSSKESYESLVSYADDKGIDCYFTSWLMPHKAFCDEASDQLQHLCGLTGARGVVFDCEEPWTQADQPHYGAAIAAVVTGLKGCRWGVTGIGWASKWVGAIAQEADVLIPQLYSTSTSGLEPKEYGGPMQHWSRWLKGGAELLPALAAYRTTASTMRAAVAEVMPETEILWWALRHMKTNKAYAAVIADLAREKQAA